jgi:hypothetical protein
MRTVTIPVYTNQKLELFVEKLKDCYEFWSVGMVKGHRVVIDHHLTHDDLETRLEYSQPEDLIWHDATPSEIPTDKHKLAIEGEESMERGVFWDGGAVQHFQPGFLTRDRKATAAAKKSILGGWTDGILSFLMEPNNKLQWSCSDGQYWLNRRQGPAPDWWALSGVWELHFMANMNTPKACGTHVGVFHVDDHELHIHGGHLNRIVHVFRRVQAA